MVFLFFTYLFITLFTLAVLYPLFYVLSASMSDPAKIVNGEVFLFPKGFTLDAYRRILTNKNIITGYGNTVFYTVAGTLYNLVMTTFAAYPLSRKDLKGNSVITFFITFTMLFGGGMIPTFLNLNNLGLINNRLVMILPGAISVTNFIIMRNYFMHSISNEILEAAYVDGASMLRTLTSVVLPLSKPIIGVLTVYYAVGHWNSYFSALIYLSDNDKMPLQIFLRRILLLGSSEGMTTGSSIKDQLLGESMKYGVIVVSMVPMLILYVLTQKSFKKGIMIGSLKG
jgi:putative aldouronate transport system permease protein